MPVFIGGEFQKHGAPCSCCWATAVPIAPGGVPITPEGLRAQQFGAGGPVER